MSTQMPEIEELIELNDALENYFRNTIIPQLFFDRNLILRKFTPPAMKQFSLKMTDIGKSIHDIHENFRFPTIIENIQQVIDNNEILEKEVQTTDLRWYQMNIIPYVESKTNFTNGVIITFIEITQRINDLKYQEKLISDHETLLDTISHDIKTPMTSLTLAIELFKNASHDNPEEYKLLLQMVETAISKMKILIHDLMDTREQEHKYIAQDELLNFGHIIEDVRLILADAIRLSHANIIAELNAPEITFSRRKLRSILFNLISNAIKFNAAGKTPEILVKTEHSQNDILISVKDNGIGIPEEMHEKIFKKYYRLQSEIDGTGIGLYIIKEMVVSSGGSISVESKPGEGAEFIIKLPAAV